MGDYGVTCPNGHSPDRITENTNGTRRCKSCGDAVEGGNVCDFCDGFVYA